MVPFQLQSLCLFFRYLIILLLTITVFFFLLNAKTPWFETLQREEGKVFQI